MSLFTVAHSIRHRILQGAVLFLFVNIHAQEKKSALKQEDAGLLSGESWAICYSGFRSGQHPDRGAGARNPSEKEMLEDLKILTKAGFKLIRLYDSRENSAAILKLIQSETLPMKVLLGAWLLSLIHI